MADEQGAPVDFGGRVFPNPSGVKPFEDTEARRKTDEPTKEGKFSVDNAAGDTEEATGGMVPNKQHPVELHFSRNKPRRNYGKSGQPTISEN